MSEQTQSFKAVQCFEAIYSRLYRYSSDCCLSLTIKQQTVHIIRSITEAETESDVLVFDVFIR